MHWFELLVGFIWGVGAAFLLMEAVELLDRGIPSSAEDERVPLNTVPLASVLVTGGASVTLPDEVRRVEHVAGVSAIWGDARHGVAPQAHRDSAGSPPGVETYV